MATTYMDSSIQLLKELVLEEVRQTVLQQAVDDAVKEYKEKITAELIPIVEAIDLKDLEAVRNVLTLKEDININLTVDKDKNSIY